MFASDLYWLETALLSSFIDRLGKGIIITNICSNKHRFKWCSGCLTFSLVCTEVQKLYYTAEENNVSLNVEKKKITVHLIKEKVLIMSPGVDVTAGPWPVYLRSGQSNWTKIGPQLSFLPCHSISTDNRLMKFPYKTLKFNFNHSPKAINSLITQSACVYLDLLPHVKRILTEIYAGNQYFIIQ